MVDGFIQVAPDGGGKKMETSELTRSDGTIVERERVALADAGNINNFAAVSADGALKVFVEKIDEVLRELKAIRQGMSIVTDYDLNPNHVDSESA